MVEGLPTLSIMLEEDERELKPIFELGLGNISNFDNDIDLLLEEIDILENNKIILKNIIYTYRGDMDEYIKLAKYSEKLNPTKHLNTEAD